MSPRVLLIGYYGKGNFGDDVLLMVTHALLQKRYPSAQFSVIVDGPHGGYVPRMLGEVTVLAPARHGHFDLMVHGGGGVFFDFARYGIGDVAKEYALRAMGYRTYLALEALARRVAGKPRTSATVRVGLGIGVGTYSLGSPRLRERLPILADFKALWVRDAQSIVNLKRFASLMRGKVVRGSDLAFLTEYWLSDMPTAKPARSGKPRLGIALRDWPTHAGGIDESTLEALLKAWSKDYDISGFILDAQADPIMQRVMAGYPLHVWRPEQQKITEYAQALASQDVLLTSRAHAAICGACVGTPSVIVAIEPKLAQVAAMLPSSTRMVSPAATDSWRAAIDEALAISRAAIEADVVNNRAASLQALASVYEVLP